MWEQRGHQTRMHVIYLVNVKVDSGVHFIYISVTPAAHSRGSTPLYKRHILPLFELHMQTRFPRTWHRDRGDPKAPQQLPKPVERVE